MDMKVVERFLSYATCPTASDEYSESSPSSSRQFVLADRLADELRTLGLDDVVRDEHCYVYGTLPATEGHEHAPRIGLIAHMDTSPDFSGEHVHPILYEHYDGRDLVLGAERTLRLSEFPHLADLRGRTLITTDGTTLLGADDKAGIAEIMTLLDELITQKLPHGKIAVSFTPDEEVGRGADHFDLKRFGADFAYTVDGGAEGEIEYENFNAASAVWEIRGFNVHPGSAKGVMINAQLIAAEINAMLPPNETPRETEGYEGFYHLCTMQGRVESARLEYIVRDHDDEAFEARLGRLRFIETAINEKYGAGTASLTIREQYRNMAKIMAQHMHLIDTARQAAWDCGITPKIQPIRGGTDGARLSYMGLPCPNLGTGGYAFHGPYEHITVEGMEGAVAMLHKIVEAYQ